MDGICIDHLTTRSPRRALIALAIVVLFVIAGARGASAHHDPGQLDQQYTLSQASTQIQYAQTGRAFEDNMMVLVCAVNTNPCQALSGIGVTFEAPTSGASGTFPGGGTSATVTSGSNGIATAPTFTANSEVGSYSVRVTANEPTPEHAVPTFFFFTNSSTDPANKVAQISDGVGLPLSAQTNTVFTPDLSLVAFNGTVGDDGVPGYAAGAIVSFVAPTSGPSGTFSDGATTYVTTTGSTGLATALPFRANRISGEYVVTATISGAETIDGQPRSISFAMRNTGTPVLGVPVVISAAAGNGQQVGVLSPYPTNLQVVVLDGAGSYVPGASVTFRTPSPAEGPSATFEGGVVTYSTTTGSTGLATAGQLTAWTSEGQFSVQVTASKNGTTISTSMVLIVGRVMTTTTVTFNPGTSSVYGQTVNVIATVRPVAGTYIPTGPVTFRRGGTIIPGCESVTPAGGIAVCAQSSGDDPSSWLTPGNYTYSASYFGDVVSQPSTSSTVPYTVNRASTTVTMTSSQQDFVIEGGEVTFTAYVRVVSPGRGVPPGELSFSSSDSTLIHGSQAIPLVDGSAQAATSALSVGQPVITAVYSGNANYLESENTIVQNVYTIPVVTTDPVSHQVLAAETATFTAVANGFPHPTVQWQVSTDGGATFSNIPGATSTTFDPDILVSPTTSTYGFIAGIAHDQRQFRAVFTNPAGTDTSAAATLTVRLHPTFTSPAAATFTVGQQGTFTLTADGHLPPTFSLTNGTVPSDLVFDPKTAILSGTPADGTGGVYTLTFTATNGISPDAVQTFTLTINEAPEITSQSVATIYIDTVSSFSPSASGYPASTFTFTGELPDGMTVAANGTLSGVPTEVGEFPLTVTASNGVLPAATQAFTLNVHRPPAFTGPMSTTFTVGQQGLFTIGTSGFPAPTLVQWGGSLPAGVTLNLTTGKLAGTPAAGTGGVYQLDLVATNGSLSTLIQTFTLTVNEAPRITSAATTILTAGTFGSFSVEAAGFPTPTLSLSGVALPTGLSFDPATGVFSGTPTAGSGGVYTIGFTASNGLAPDATQSFTLTVNQAPQVTSPAEVTFTVGTSGSFSVTAAGFPTPTLSLSGVPLPAGLSFDEETGVLSGTPAAGSGGVYAIKFSAANGVGDNVGQYFTLTVNEAPAITSDATASFIAGAESSYSLAASGYPAPTFSADGDLPEGVSLEPSGLLSGTPLESGFFSVTITASNGVSPDATQSFLLTVVKAEQEPVVLSVSSASGVTGDSLTLTVSGGSGSGVVSFDAGASTACTVGADAGTLLITDGAGACEVTATKDGDTIYIQAISAPVAVEVGPASSDLSVAVATGAYDGTTALSATLASDGAPVDGRVVAFTVNGVAVGTATTDGAGVATLVGASLSGLNAGTYAAAVEASFAGDSAYLGSAGSADLSVAKAAGSVSISNLPATANAGNNIVPTYGALGNGTPSAVSLTAATCTVDDGVIAFVAEGVCELQAAITEGDNHLAATGAVQSVTVTVQAKLATITTLTSSANPAVVGQEVTFTAQVVPAQGSGTVTFFLNGSPLGSAEIGPGSRTSITIAASAAGDFEIKAVYGGGATHGGSSSSIVLQVVRAATTTTLTSSANPATAGQPVTFTAQVSCATAATGTVTFMAGKEVLGTAPVVNGQASLTVTLKNGKYTVMAVYSGDAACADSASAPLTQMVSKK